MESEQEDFYQQLTDKRGAVHYKTNYIDKKVRLFGEKQANYKSTLVADISKQIITRDRVEGKEKNNDLIKFVDESIFVRQLNLRMPYNAIDIITGNDEKIWFCPLSLNVPRIDGYISLNKASQEHGTIYSEIKRYFNFLETSDDDAERKGFKPGMGGKKFTSCPDSELIEAYDKNTNKRAAVFDRGAFLTLEYKRASIWGFIFNRRGELLLHKRSKKTADNREMWDKSTGGHVDLDDASTVETAKREFIEEVYMKDAEYSNYNDSKTEMVVDFGEWRRALRADESFIEAFAPFTGKDKHVIMFRAFVEGNKSALTVDRASERTITDKEGKTIKKPTRFRSDVFFFITAEGEMDTEDQMKTTFRMVGTDSSNKSAAMDHKLILIEDLEREVLASVNDRNLPQYTDDMIHIVKDYSGYLTEFSSFIKDTFERIGLQNK